MSVAFDGSTLYDVAGNFSEEDIGSTFYANDGTIFFIKDIVDATTVNVGAAKDTPLGQYVGEVVPRINAQFFDNLNSVRYFLIGTKVYARIGREEEWIEYFILGDQPTNTTSQMFKIKDKIVLTNSNGVFILNSVYDGKYGWKTNDYLPDFKLDNPSPEINATKPSAYNYVYSYTRLNGVYTKDRNSIDTFTEVETPPFLLENDIVPVDDYEPEVLNTDYTTMYSNSPIQDVYKQEFQVATKDFNSYVEWVEMSEDNQNPSLTIEIDGESHVVYFDFSNVESMDDVTSALDRGIKDFSEDFVVLRKLSYDQDKGEDVNTFTIYNEDDSVSWQLVPVDSVPSSRDLLFTSVLEAVFIYEPSMGVSIGKFRYPTNRTDITHYSVYRTKDIYPYTRDVVDLTDDRIGNSSSLFSWVADIPVVDVINGSFTYNAIEARWEFEFSGDSSDHIIGSTYTVDEVANVVKFSILGKIPNTNKYSASLFGLTGDLVDVDAVSGTDTVFTASKTGQDIVFTGFTPTEDDIGKPIFWRDGTVSYLISTTQTLDSDSKASQRAYINPTERNYHDTMTDNVRDGYAQYLTLKTRFYNKLPQSNLAAYNKGLLVVALRDYNKLYYTGTADLTTIGYHHPFQINDSIEKGIRCMFVVSDIFTFLTTSSTHTINPKQAQVLETNFGEFYTVMPDAFLVNGTIGGASQHRWSESEKGDVMIITNEPAVRFFDGATYTANVADGKIQHTELQLLNENMLMSYSATGGVHIWGFRSDVWQNK
jgi:hypothetical protein